MPIRNPLQLTFGLALALPAAWLAWQEAPGGRASSTERLAVPAITGPTPLGLDLDARLRLALSEAKADVSGELAAKARTSLEDTALATASTMTLASLVQEPAKSELAMLAEKTGRRDAVTQLFLMQAAARRGDEGLGLVHLDRVLTVSPAVAPLVFPVMTKALAEPEFNKGIRPLVDRPWFSGFLSHAASQAEDPGLVAGLIMDVKLPEESRFAQDVAPRLLERLVSKGQFREAIALATTRLGVPSSALERFGLPEGANAVAAPPLTWKLSDDMSISARAVGNGVLAAEVSADRSAILARRFTNLAPGSYQLQTEVRPVAGGAEAALRWEMTCIGEGAQARWSQAMPYPASRQRFAMAVRIPSGCAVQDWRIMAASRSRRDAATFELGSVQLSASGS